MPEQIPGLPAGLVKADNPSELYAFACGFVIYIVLARLRRRCRTRPRGQVRRRHSTGMQSTEDDDVR